MFSVQESKEWETVVIRSDPDFPKGLPFGKLGRAQDISEQIYPYVRKALEGTTKKNIRIIIEYDLPVSAIALSEATKKVIEEDGIRKDINHIVVVDERTKEDKPVYPVPDWPILGPFRPRDDKN